MRSSSINVATFVTGMAICLALWLVPADAHSALMIFAAAPDEATPDPCGCACGTPPVCVTDLDCDDSNACNGAETCSLGICQPGLELLCDNGNVCDGIETCNPQTGCEVNPGMQCDDGDLCTGSEICDPSLGCILGTQVICDPCAFGEVGTCDPSFGCSCFPPPCDVIDCGSIGSVDGTCDSSTFGCDYDLIDASLVGEDLSDINLSGMDFSGADLRSANLQNANLSDADLSGADLSTADLTGADLLGAQYNTETIFPLGFDPVAAGMVLVSGIVPSVGLLGMSALVGLLLLTTLSVRKMGAQRG